MHQYDGSIIVVSHNRYFLDHFTKKILEIKNGKATIFEGNISYYIAKTQALKKEATAASTEPSPLSAADTGSQGKGKKARQEQAQLREQENKLLGPLKKKARDNEKAVEKLEGQKSSLEQLLADPQLYQDQEKFMRKNNEYTNLKNRLQQAYTTWEETQEKLEQVLAQ
jgi:ATP-binding cassette subfamily F protein 3